MQSHFNLSLVIIENIIVENQKVAGDYMIVLDKNKYLLESIKKEIEILFKLMSSNSFIKSLGHKIITVHKDALLHELSYPDNLLIGALPMSEDLYKIFLVSRTKIINDKFFKKRRILNNKNFI
jgi:hypothetical protein